jgi:hypothetical protein
VNRPWDSADAIFGGMLKQSRPAEPSTLMPAAFNLPQHLAIDVTLAGESHQLIGADSRHQTNSFWDSPAGEEYGVVRAHVEPSCSPDASARNAHKEPVSQSFL